LTFKLLNMLILQVKINYLYRTTNRLTGSYYIGVHRTDSPIKDGYLGSGTALVAAIEKYGKENFEHVILKTFDTYEDCLKAEEEFLTEEVLSDPKCYNLKAGGRGGAHPGNSNAKGMTYTHSAEARKRIAEAKIGFKLSEESIQKIRKNRKGKGVGPSNAMADPTNVEKIRQAKLGRKWIYSPDRSEFKQIHPNSPLWKELVSSGWSPRSTTSDDLS
jgi:hypothetical protein